MGFIPVIAAAAFGLLMALGLGSGTTDLIVFVVLGVIAGFLSGMRPKGAELVYWFGVFAIIAMIVLSYMGNNIPGVVFFAPVVIMLTYFVARLVGRFTGQRKSLPGA